MIFNQSHLGWKNHPTCQPAMFFWGYVWRPVTVVKAWSSQRNNICIVILRQKTWTPWTPPKTPAHGVVVRKNCVAGRSPKFVQQVVFVQQFSSAFPSSRISLDALSMQCRFHVQAGRRAWTVSLLWRTGVSGRRFWRFYFLHDAFGGVIIALYRGCLVDIITKMVLCKGTEKCQDFLLRLYGMNIQSCWPDKRHSSKSKSKREDRWRPRKDANCWWGDQASSIRMSCN